MKTPKILIGVVVILLFTQFTFGQNQKFKMLGSNQVNLELNNSYTESTEIFPFSQNNTKVYGLAVSATI